MIDIPPHERVADAIGKISDDLGLEGPALSRPSVVFCKAEDDFDKAVQMYADTPLAPACMIKVPLAAAYFALFDSGVFRPDDTLEVGENDYTSTPCPTPYNIGVRDSILSYLEYCLRCSDNIATNVLIEALDREEATSILQGRFGLADTIIARKLSGHEPLVSDPNARGRNRHTARDAARLFWLMERREVPGAEKMMEWMLWNSTDSGFDESDTVIQKTGYTSCGNHVAGIVRLAPNNTSFAYSIFTSMPYSQSSCGIIRAFVTRLRRNLTEWIEA